MPIAISLRREFELTGNDLNADPCLFPRFVSSATFVQACNFETSSVADVAGKYDAFPDPVRIGATILCLFSRGPAHAQSDSQIMARSDDNGKTWSSVIFVTDAAPTTFDTSLISGLLGDGQSIVLKTYTIKNVGGSLVVSVVSTVPYLGDNYALWSPARQASDRLLRSGYAAGKAAVFESLDGGENWSFKAMVFSESGKTYSEFDLVNTGGTNWTAVCREDSGASNPLYIARSTDDCANWSAPAAIPTTSINGRQPNLLRLSDGSLVLATGDRAGVTGVAGNGELLFGLDTTGIALVKTTDNGATWGFRTMVAGIYSTDGGQPRMVNLGGDRILCLYYAARTVREKTGVRTSSLDSVVL